MKQTRASLILVLAVLAYGCTTDEELTTSASDENIGKQTVLTVSAEAEAITRIDYDDDNVGTAKAVLTWQKNDKLAVVGFDNDNIYKGKADYTLNSEDEGKGKGSFIGDAIDDATIYNIYYPSTITIDDIGTSTFLLNDQSQEGDGSTAHLKNNIFLQATNVTDLNNITLEMQSSIMKFELSNVPASVGKLKKLAWIVETDNGSKSLELSFPAEGNNVVTFSNNKTTLNAYLAFITDEMKVKTNGKFIVMLEGESNYYAETTIASGKTYAKGQRYTTKIDGDRNNTLEWKGAFVVNTTIAPSAGYHYNSLEMELGSWESENSPTQKKIATATIVGGKAFFSPSDFSSLSANTRIWICIPKVVKFFHRLTAAELNSKTLTLPDKDTGSTLKETPTIGAENKRYVNDWIVALYMGINKYNGITETDIPLYWATGNLIATKTNIANSGSTTTVFHVATADESIAEGKINTVYYTTPATADRYTIAGMVINAIDGYSGCTAGSQWDMFGWGDATGLKTSKTDNDYPIKVTNICGTDQDICRSALGGSWRLPSGGIVNDVNGGELYAMKDISSSWYDDNGSGIICTYTDKINSINVTFTNTLLFPATGSRLGIEVGGRGNATAGDYWSGALIKGNTYRLRFAPTNKIWLATNVRREGHSARPVSE